MASQFLETIKSQLKVALFNDDDLKLLFREAPVSAIYNSLSYHLKQNNLVRHRRGLYSLSSSRNGRYEFSKFQLANKLVLHSCISFESALSHHGLIPEAVHEVTSATLTKNKTFENSLGRFSYTYSPVEPFYLGVEKDEITSSKIANPLRALFDLVNSRRKKYERIEDLETDLRVDLLELQECLSEFRASEILELGDLYKKSTTRNLAKILVKGLK